MKEKKKEYYLWIRWKNGERDCFRLTKESYNRWAKMHFKKWVHLETSPNGVVFINIDEAAAYKFLQKTVDKATPRNPLNDKDYYDDPLN